MKINSICILGGGTSGFSIASLLARYREMSGLDYDIKLVHSEKIGTIGVGESTILTINVFLKFLGLDDKAWMSKCDATYKTAIKFTDFNKGSYFYYPFGQIFPHQDNAESVKKWFIAKEFYPEICTPEKASLYYVRDTIFAEKNKLTRECFDFDTHTAYQFDASKLGKILKQYSEERGVEIVDDKFLEAELNEDGSIRSLICENGIHEADLFVDCSGFESLLLGEVMKEEFIPFTNTLINNKAIVARIPYTNKEDQLKNYTDCVALKNGWCWEIPLWNNMSVGYVHTNKFATEEEIEKEFFDRYGEVEYRTVEYKTGRYKRGWVKNVVGVGLAYGFLEPLESTGLASTFINCFRLLECISKREMNCTQIDRDIFNTGTGEYGIDKWRAQIEMHYFLSVRSDSNYWKYVTEDIDYRNGIDSPFSYENLLYQCGVTRDLHCDEPGFMFIVAGMNYSYFSRAVLLSEELDKEGYNMRDFAHFVKEINIAAMKFPSTFKFLQDNIYAEVSVVDNIKQFVKKDTFSDFKL